jgi:hypothetical protein
VGCPSSGDCDFFGLGLFPFDVSVCLLPLSWADSAGSSTPSSALFEIDPSMFTLWLASFFPDDFFDDTGQSLKASFGSGTDELLKGFVGALFWSAFPESELEGFFFCIGTGDLVLIGAFAIFLMGGGGLRSIF